MTNRNHELLNSKCQNPNSKCGYVASRYADMSVGKILDFKTTNLKKKMASTHLWLAVWKFVFDWNLAFETWSFPL